MTTNTQTTTYINTKATCFARQGFAYSAPRVARLVDGVSVAGSKICQFAPFALRS